jgi:hypothetical protein
MKWFERGDQWWKASAARTIAYAELLVLDKDDTCREAARVVGFERPGSRNPVVYLRDIEIIG